MCANETRISPDEFRQENVAVRRTFQVLKGFKAADSDSRVAICIRRGLSLAKTRRYDLFRIRVVF